MTGRTVRFGVAAIALVLLVGGCARTSDGAALYGDRSSTTTVKDDALSGLMPSDAQISEIMGRPQLQVQTRIRRLQSLTNVNPSEPKCLGVIFGLLESDYRGAGYHGTAGTLSDDPETPYAPDLLLGVTTFEDGDAAARFVEASVATWSDCADRPLVDRLKDSDFALTWVSTPPVVTDGVHTTTRTLEAQRGYGCTRGLSSRSNVVADVDVCALDAGPTAQQAATLVNAVLDRIGT